MVKSAAQLDETYAPRIHVSQAGRLDIDGRDATGLAKEFGTPLWVISEGTIRANYHRLKAAFEREYPNFRLVYASKANPEPAILRILKLEGALVDAVTMGHLQLILKAGYEPRDIVFNGNGKTLDELRWALANRIGFINVDSLEEMEAIAGLQPRESEPISICLRLAIDERPHVADDPEFADSWKSSKFGMDETAALAAADIAAHHPGIKLVGLHNHVGFSAYGGIAYSAALDLRRHQRCIEQTLAFAATLKRSRGIAVHYLNLGGGYRVGRHEGFGPKQLTSFPSADDYAQAIGGCVARLCKTYELEEPQLMLEAGGYLVADSEVLLGTVGFTKEVPGSEGPVKWVFLENTSAYHFVRRLMYDFYHHVVAVDKSQDGKVLVNIAGPVCTTDTIAYQIALPPLARGDLIAVLDQGAYCEAVTSDFCAVPVPAAVLVSNGQAEIVRRRESLEEISNRFAIPSWLS